MQKNLKDHFNRQARRKKARERYLTLWLLLPILQEQERQLRREIGHLTRPFGPGW